MRLLPTFPNRFICADKVTRFYQYYCINGQTYLKKDVDNSRYPNVKPVTFKEYAQSHELLELGDSVHKLASSA